MNKLQELLTEFQELEVQLLKVNPCIEMPECMGCADTVENILEEINRVSKKIDYILNNNYD